MRSWPILDRIQPPAARAPPISCWQASPPPPSSSGGPLRFPTRSSCRRPLPAHCRIVFVWTAKSAAATLGDITSGASFPSTDTNRTCGWRCGGRCEHCIPSKSVLVTHEDPANFVLAAHEDPSNFVTVWYRRDRGPARLQFA